MKSSGLGTEASTAGAIVAALARRHIDRPVVAFAGEGRLVDMGLADLSNVFASGAPYLQVVFDNQGFSASGSGNSTTTDLGASTNVNLSGKPTPRKDPALMMMFTGAAYVATASPAFVPDYVRKLRRGLERMPAFIHVLTPCTTTWGYDPAQSVRLAQLSVETGLFPLWEYDDGCFRRTRRFKQLKAVTEYTRLQRRYAHVSPEQLGAIESYIARHNRLIDGLEHGLAGDLPATGSAELEAPALDDRVPPSGEEQRPSHTS